MLSFIASLFSRPRSDRAPTDTPPREVTERHEERLAEITSVLRSIEEQTRSVHYLLASWIMGRPFESDGRSQDPKSLTRFNRSVYSQLGEDGIVSEIFSRIGQTDQVFVECGVGNGLQNTTRFLLEGGWRGYWIEGNTKDVLEARQIWKSYIESGQLTIIEAFITAENIDDLMQGAGVPPAFDYLSVDLDYVTPHIWKAISRRSRVACIEMNPSMPPNVAMTVPYIADRLWDGTNWYGGSLKALEMIGQGKGMALVGCDATGSNGFFVRQDEANGRFREPFDADTHYEPPRNYYPHGLHHPSPSDPREWVRN